MTLFTKLAELLGSLKRQAAKAENREDLKQEILGLDLKVYKHGLSSLKQREEKYEASVSEVKAQEGAAEAAYQDCYQADQALRSELMMIDGEADEFRYKIDAARESLNKIAQAKVDKSNKLSKLKTDIATAQQIQTDVVDRLQSLAERIVQVETDKSELQVSREELETKAEELEVNNHTEQEKVYQQLQVSKKSQQEVENEFRDLREKLVSLQTEQKTLSRQVESNLKPEELKKIANEIGFEEEISVLLEGISIESKYTEALEAVLAEKASFVVTEEPAKMAQKLVEATANSNEKPSIGFIQAGHADWNSDSAHGFQAILDFVTCPSKYTSALRSLLKNVYLIDSIEDAWNFFASNPRNFTKFVTLDGVLVTRNCVYFASKSSGILKVKNRLEDLTTMIAEIEGEIATCKESREEMALTVKSEQQTYDALMQQARNVQAESRDLSSKIGALNGRMQSEDRLIDQLKSDVTRLEEKTEQSKRNEAKWEEELSSFDEVYEVDDSEEEEINANLLSLNEEYQAKESVRKTKRAELDECAANLNTLRIKLDQAKQNASGSALEKEKIALEREALIDKMEIDYGSEFYQEQAFSTVSDEMLAEEEYREAKERQQKLRNRLIREGEIDPESIERYQEEKTRLEDLEAQKTDLSSALKSIEQTLEKLKATSEVRFQETFEMVQQNFSRLIPKLFGGGHGDLSLSDPDNPLNSGLEISAKPPGKKLKNIELMSGGEKAMCATALIVSMFMVRPSPLCILDEVDAPLDEANLARFLGVIKEMSSETQFLLITHNKQSMSVADKLVGVTMQQPGASNVLAVGLSEAYAQVA